jgi:hypothetical protein
MKTVIGDKPKKRRAATRKERSDPLSREHSKRHGRAVKRGIKQAKQVKQAVLKAVSRSKGKTKAQVAAELLEGSGRGHRGVHAQEDGEDSPRGGGSPSLARDPALGER